MVPSPIGESGCTLDLNLFYAAHQRALMDVGEAATEGERLSGLAKASDLAGRISIYQHKLGAAAACGWTKAQFTPAK